MIKSIRGNVPVSLIRYLRLTGTFFFSYLSMRKQEDMLLSSSVSNDLDKLVQRIGQTCLMNWTNVSNELDKRVQRIGQTCPENWTDVSNELDKRVQ